jgi:hypothetical protein
MMRKHRPQLITHPATQTFFIVDCRQAGLRQMNHIPHSEFPNIIDLFCLYAFGIFWSDELIVVNTLGG